MRRAASILVSGLLLTVLAAPPALGQTQPAATYAITPAQYRLLRSQAFADQVEGKNVRITLAGGVRFSGRVKSVQSTALVVNGTSVPFGQIAKVEKASHGTRNGLLIGLGVGMGLGLLAGFNAAEEPEELYGFLAVLGGLGAGIGAGYGSMRHGEVFYEAPRRTTIALAPIVTPTRKGVAFSMSWR